MSEWMNEMKIDEISPFPISRISLRFSIPREFLYLILLLILLLFIVIIIYSYHIHLDSERRNGSKTEENKNEWNQNVSTVEVERRRRDDGMSRKIGVWIPHGEVWDAFRRFVEKKWGKKHSMMGMELENALILYMERYAEEHTHTQKMSGRSEGGVRAAEHVHRGGDDVHNDISYASMKPQKPHYSRRRLEEAKMRLEEKGMWEAIHNGGFVHMNAVKRVIREVVGYDKRTIDKYFNLLCEVYALTTDEKGKVIPSPW